MTKPKMFRRTAISVALGVAALFAFTSTASAAPNEVTISPSVVGNNVYFSLDNGSAKSIGCDLFGFVEGVDPGTEPFVFGYASPSTVDGLVLPGTSKPVQLRLAGEGSPEGPTGSFEIPDGTYDVYWACRTVTPGADPADEEYWGSNPPLINGETTDFAEVVTITVPGDDPDPTDPTDPPADCAGSLCLPSIGNLISGS